MHLPGLTIDGDTVKCDGQNLRPIGDGAPYVSGFDTPETGGRAKCTAERMLAELASKRMGEFIATQGLVIEDTCQKDRWGRPLVVLRLLDGSTVGQRMIDEGYAEVWLPGREVEWCVNGG
ncbi:MAG: thermonuclease family protein [Hyphomicrobiales bacterium]|nr:thermonuclease family protein [Hyphomicrobiales bacterium]